MVLAPYQHGSSPNCRAPKKEQIAPKCCHLSRVMVHYSRLGDPLHLGHAPGCVRSTERLHRRSAFFVHSPSIAGFRRVNTASLTSGPASSQHQAGAVLSPRSAHSCPKVSTSARVGATAPITRCYGWYTVPPRHVATSPPVSAPTPPAREPPAPTKPAYPARSGDRGRLPPDTGHRQAGRSRLP